MPNIHHEVIIAAPAYKIYNAITSQEGLSACWTPGVKAKHELNSIAHFPFGPGYSKEMKIMELDEPAQVEWICIAGAGEWVGTIISFKLQYCDEETLLRSYPEMKGQVEQQKDDGKRTVLIFHHDDWKEYTPMFAECNYTWAQFLRSLKLYCETGVGRPWPNQHRVEP